MLAYTLLGVDWNELSGEARFLILDPHYTGEDNIKSVIDKGCYWKGPELFLSKNFYNFCLPLRPRIL